MTKPFDIQELRLRVRNSLEQMGQNLLTNPISGFPEGALVDERLGDCLRENDQALLLISLENLENFRELYGFVASDDVLRAVSLMIHTAIQEVDGTQSFLGHLTATEFIIMISLGKGSALAKNIINRLEQSLDYFYPIRDRDKAVNWPDRLAIKTAQIDSDAGAFRSPAELKKELLKLKK